MKKKKLTLKKSIVSKLTNDQQSTVKGGFSFLTACVACRTVQTGESCYGGCGGGTESGSCAESCMYGCPEEME